MTKKHVITRPIGVLLWASLLNWTTGNGLFPLLPLYALERGATIEAAGTMLAAGFVGLAVGSIIAARLSRIVGSRKWTYVGAAVLQTLAYALLGRATEAWQLLILLLCAWLGAGVATTTIQALVGLAASAERRGRVFGLFALAPPVGAVIGAALLGALAARSGYHAAFDAGALLVLGAAFLVALSMPADPLSPTGEPAADRPVRPAWWRSRIEVALLFGALLASTALFFGRLTTPVVMLALSFDAQAIAATAAVGGLVTAPFVLLLGDLSDRLGRRPMLIATYGLIALASGILALADQPWHFYLAAALLSLGFAASGSVTAALAGDLLPPTALPAALGRLSAITWIAAVVAFAGGGALLGHVAASALCLAAALLALSAGLPLALLHRTLHVAQAWQERRGA
jgi:MFS family permease